MKAVVKRSESYDDALKITVDSVSVRAIESGGEVYYSVRDIIAALGVGSPERFLYNEIDGGRQYDTRLLRYPNSDDSRKRYNIRCASRDEIRKMLKNIQGRRFAKDFVMNYILDSAILPQMEQPSDEYVEEIQESGQDVKEKEDENEIVVDEEKPAENKNVSIQPQNGRDELNRKLDMILVSLIELKKELIQVV